MEVMLPQLLPSIGTCLVSPRQDQELASIVPDSKAHIAWKIHFSGNVPPATESYNTIPRFQGLGNPIHLV